MAPAWVADGRPVYGGFFWINGDGGLPIPKDSYYVAGAGEQYTVSGMQIDMPVLQRVAAAALQTGVLLGEIDALIRLIELGRR